MTRVEELVNSFSLLMANTLKEMQVEVKVRGTSAPI